MKMLIGKKRSC